MASATRMDAMLRGQSALAQKVFSAMSEDKLQDLPMIKRYLEKNELVGTIEQPKLLACLGALKDARLITEPKAGQYKRRSRPGPKRTLRPAEPQDQGMLVPQPVLVAAVVIHPVEEPEPVEPVIEAPAPAQVEAEATAVVTAVVTPVADAPVVEVVEAPAPVVVKAVIEAPAPVAAEAPAHNKSLDVLSELAAEVVTLGEEMNARLKSIAARIEEAALLREDHAEQAEKLKKLQDFVRSL